MSRYFVIKLFLLLFVYGIHSQSKTIDSLSQLLQTNREETNYVKHLNALIVEYIKSAGPNYKVQAISAYNKAVSVSKNINYINGLGNSNFAIHSLYSALAKQDSALYFLFRSAKYFEQTHNQAKLINAYTAISRIYFYLDNPIESNKYLNKVLAYCESNKNTSKEKLVQIYMSKAVIVQNITDSFEVANKYFQKSIACSEETKSNYLGILYTNYAEYLATNLFNPAEAVFYFNKAKEYAHSKKDSSLIAYSEFGLAKLFILQKKFEDAKKLLEKSVGFYERNKTTSELSRELNYLSDCYYNLGDYKNCVLTMKKTNRLNDSLTQLSNTKNIRELETKYEVEKKDKELYVLREKAIAEKLEKEKQENKNLLLLISISVLFVLGGFVLYAYLNKQKANKLLNKEKKLVVEQKNILELKNKEILDSIHYAKRIQTSLLPTEKYIDKHLND